MKRLAFLFISVFLLVSCANKSLTRYEELVPTMEKQGYDATIKKMKEKQEKLYGEKSEFLYYFDLGVLNHYNRNFKESSVNFAKAEQIYDDLFTKSVSNEAAAVLTNDNMRPYRAKPFELLLMYELQILNYLAMMDIDGAMVEVRRSQIALNALYQKNNQKVNDNGLLRYLSAFVYDLDGSTDDAAISYINAVKAYKENKLDMPNEVFEFVTEGLRKADREDELAPLGFKVPEKTPKASAIRDNGQEIIVIGYAGHSPILGEQVMSGTFISGGPLNLYYKDENDKKQSITIPAPIVPGAMNGETFHISIAIPKIKKLNNSVDRFAISLNKSNTIYPEKVMDFQMELEQNMKDDQANIMARTAARVAIRTISAQTAKSAIKTDNALLNLATSLTTDIAQSQMEKADLRVGLFMPNALFMTRIPVDVGTHSIAVSSLGKNGETIQITNFDNIKVAKGQKTFLFVPSIK